MGLLSTLQPPIPRIQAVGIYSGVLVSYLFFYTAYSKQEKKIKLESLKELFWTEPIVKKTKGSWTKVLVEVNKIVSLAALTCLSGCALVKLGIVFSQSYKGEKSAGAPVIEKAVSSSTKTSSSNSCSAAGLAGSILSSFSGAFGMGSSTSSPTSASSSSSSKAPADALLVGSISDNTKKCPFPLCCIKGIIRKCVPSCAVVKELALVSAVFLYAHTIFSAYHFYGETLMPRLSSYGKELKEDLAHIWDTSEVKRTMLRKLGKSDSGKFIVVPKGDPTQESADQKVIETEAPPPSPSKMDSQRLVRTVKKVSVALGVSGQIALTAALFTGKNTELLLAVTALGLGHFYLMELDNKWRLQVRPYAKCAVYLPLITLGLAPFALLL